MKATNQLIKNLIAALEKKRRILNLEPQAFHLLLTLWREQKNRTHHVQIGHFKEQLRPLSYCTILTIYKRLAASGHIIMEKHQLTLQGPRRWVACITPATRAHLDEKEHKPASRAS
jgi:hypothetical protein